MSSHEGRLDGLVVEMYDGKFGGTFEMDTEIGESIRYDDVVTFMVVAQAGRASFDTNKSGDLKRTNVFEVANVSIVPNEMAVKIANGLGVLADGVNGGQLHFDQGDVTAEFVEDDHDGYVVVDKPGAKIQGHDSDLDAFLNSDEDF